MSVMQDTSQRKLPHLGKAPMSGWHCPCGSRLHEAPEGSVPVGEIVHYRAACTACGATWLRRQVGWSAWQWERTR